MAVTQQREVWVSATKIGTRSIQAVDEKDDSDVFVRESILHHDGPLWSCDLCGKGIPHTLKLHRLVRKR